MKNPFKNKGLYYEARVAYQLKKQGFAAVSFTKETSDYGTDIVCFDLQGRLCAIQCKYYNKPVGYEAVEQAFAGANYYNCQRAMLITNKGFTKNAKHGASVLGVELYVYSI